MFIFLVLIILLILILVIFGYLNKQNKLELIQPHIQQRNAGNNQKTFSQKSDYYQLINSWEELKPGMSEKGKSCYNAKIT